MFTSVSSGVYPDEKKLDEYGGEVVTFETVKKTPGLRYVLVATYKFNQEQNGKFIYKLQIVRIEDIVRE